MGGEILSYAYEVTRLKIGVDVFYRPDFTIYTKERNLTMLEVKGHKREAAMVRFRSAALQHPWFRFEVQHRP